MSHIGSKHTLSGRQPLIAAFSTVHCGGMSGYQRDMILVDRHTEPGRGKRKANQREERVSISGRSRESQVADDMRPEPVPHPARCACCIDKTGQGKGTRASRCCCAYSVDWHRATRAVMMGGSARSGHCESAGWEMCSVKDRRYSFTLGEVSGQTVAPN